VRYQPKELREPAMERVISEDCPQRRQVNLGRVAVRAWATTRKGSAWGIGGQPTTTCFLMVCRGVTITRSLPRQWWWTLVDAQTDTGLLQ
jgi:hypothetical protein